MCEIKDTMNIQVTNDKNKTNDKKRTQNSKTKKEINTVAGAHKCRENEKRRQGRQENEKVV